MIYIIVALSIIFIILIWWIYVSNKIIKLSIKIDESISGIDIALSKRYEVLTKMIEVVKAYTKHEKEIIFEVVKLRKEMSIEEKMNENKKMNKNQHIINISVEKYPDLKANENFKILQKAIVDVEEHLQAARRLYNSNVSAYNQSIIIFPSNIIAKAKGLKQQEFFKSDDKLKNM